jgi:Phosphotransferase system, HPr-related proteins
MKRVKILVNSIEKVKDFVNTISKHNAEFDMVSGRYVIDAKSIMGIFSLDLSEPIELVIHAEGEQADTILDSIKAYIVE